MLKAFHGKKSVKDRYLVRVLAHEKADEIIKGKYWENGKGCAVGCTIHGSEHARYETELGIPEWLVRVEDTLFEGMSNDKAKTWPSKFLEAIRPGANLEKAKAPFMICVLKSALKNFDHDKYPEVKKSLDKVIKLYRTNGTPEQFKDAVNTTYAAANAAAAASDVAYAAVYAASFAAYAYAATYPANAINAAAYDASGAYRISIYDGLAAELLKILKEL